MNQRVLIKNSALSFGLILLILVGAWVYFVNNRKSEAYEDEVLKYERKIIQISDVNIEYVLAINENRGYIINQTPEHKQNYHLFKNSVFKKLSVYEENILTEKEENSFKNLVKDLNLGFAKMNRHIYKVDSLVQMNGLENMQSKTALLLKISREVTASFDQVESYQIA